MVNTIPVGTEPYGLALTPAGTQALRDQRPLQHRLGHRHHHELRGQDHHNVGPEPRGIAITNSGSGDDTQETVFVTQFLSLPIDGQVDGADDAKAGHVTVISAATDTVHRRYRRSIRSPTPASRRSAMRFSGSRRRPRPLPTDFKFVTGAYPNQLNNIAIRGKFAFVPNTGASPNGPFRFDVNTQSLLSVIDTTTRRDAGKTINMHSAVAAQTATPKRFITQPWAIALKHKADEGYVVSAASNIVVKLKIDPATGAAVVQNDPTDTTRVLADSYRQEPARHRHQLHRPDRVRHELRVARRQRHRSQRLRREGDRHH